MDESSEVDEQKGLLRALVTVSRSASVTLIADGTRLIADGETLPGVLAGVSRVTSQLAAHSIRSIRFGEGAKAAELLGVARIIAAVASANDGGLRVRQQLADLKPKAITFEPPPAAPGLGSVVDEAESLVSELATGDVRTLSAIPLLAKLENTRSAAATTRVLEDLVGLAEHSLRAGKIVAVAEIVEGVTDRERHARGEDTRRAYALALRRLSKPALLRAIAKVVAANAELRKRYLRLLELRGEDGADAVIELVSQATTRVDRQLLIGILKQLESATPALVRLLGDPRWFEARNAAELLAELGALDAQDALIGLIRHTDDRVRRAATNALVKLNTPDALRAVHDAVSDDSPEVRMQAVAALAAKRDAKTAAILLRVVDDEADADVQVAIIAGLGKVATSEAVQKLLKIAAPEGRLFRRKTSPLRVAAVQALGEAGTPAAVAALKELTDDKDRDVRETAMRALAHAAR